MDDLSISPNAVRQMVQSSGAIATLESVTEAQKQAVETATTVQPSQNSATDPGVGEKVDVSA